MKSNSIRYGLAAVCTLFLAFWVLIRGVTTTPVAITTTVPPPISSKVTLTSKRFVLPEPKAGQIPAATLEAPPAVPQPPPQAPKATASSQAVSKEWATQFGSSSNDDLVRKLAPGIIALTNEQIRQKGGSKPDAAMLADERGDVGFVATRIAANAAFEETARKNGHAEAMRQALEYYRLDPKKNGSPVIRLAQVWDAANRAEFSQWHQAYNEADQPAVERLIFKGLSLSAKLNIADYPPTHPYYDVLANGYAVMHVAKEPEKVRQLALASTTNATIRGQLFHILGEPEPPQQ